MSGRTCTCSDPDSMLDPTLTPENYKMYSLLDPLFLPQNYKQYKE